MDFTMLSQQIEALRKQCQVAGISVALTDKDQTLFAQGFGTESVERPFLQVTPHTRFKIASISKMITGIEIHPGATIGRGLVIDHGAGVVIGETAEIGDNCTIYQGVTLGGTGKDVGKRHPTLGNGVLVGAGAKVLGPLTIGDNAKIAAGAVALRDIPAGSTAVGIPARVVSVDGVRVTEDLDQIHIPDPVKEELASLGEELKALRAEVAALKKSAQEATE